MYILLLLFAIKIKSKKVMGKCKFTVNTKTSFQPLLLFCFHNKRFLTKISKLKAFAIHSSSFLLYPVYRLVRAEEE